MKSFCVCLSQIGLWRFEGLCEFVQMYAKLKTFQSFGNISENLGVSNFEKN